jgi:hypothetical protein
MTMAAIEISPEAASQGGSLTRSRLAFKVLQGIGIVAFVAQIAIQTSYDNVFAAALALGSSTLTLQYLRRTRAFAEVPVSSFALLGLSVTSQWGALAAQSASLIALAESLYDPVRTYALLSLFQLVAVTAHWLFRNLHFTMSARAGIANRVLEPLGLFTIPSTGNLWTLGAIGMVAMFGFGTASATGEAGGTTSFMGGFTFLAWAPCLIPFLYQRFGRAYCAMRCQAIAIGLYLLLAAALSMAINHRYIMFAGFTSALLLALMMLLGDERPARLPKLWKIVLIALLASFAIKLAADFSTAMAVARSARGTASPLMLLRETMYALFDPHAIQLYRDWERDLSIAGLYDENYIVNAAAARFIDTKFHDNMFAFIQGLQPSELAELRRLTVDQLWTILPRPVLNFIDVNVVKWGETASIGDYLFHFKYGGEGLGHFKTGSVFAHGLALFPLTFPLIYLLVCLLLFLAWEMQSRPIAGGGVEISPLAMLKAWPLFTGGITAESIGAVVGFPLRGVWQNIALYLVVFVLSRLLFRPFDPNQAQRVGPATEAGGFAR